MSDTLHTTCSSTHVKLPATRSCKVNNSHAAGGGPRCSSASPKHAVQAARHHPGSLCMLSAWLACRHDSINPQFPLPPASCTCWPAADSSPHPWPRSPTGALPASRMCSRTLCRQQPALLGSSCPPHTCPQVAIITTLRAAFGLSHLRGTRRQAHFGDAIQAPIAPLTRPVPACRPPS